MTRNILPKSDEMSSRLSERANINNTDKTSFSNSMSNSDDDEQAAAAAIETNSSNGEATQQIASFSLHPPFARTRLNQWHTNEEIHSILTKCNDLVSLINTGTLIKLTGGDEASTTTTRLVTPGQLLSEWLSDEVQQRPRNGSVFLFDRRRCKSFKKDAYVWKRRKTGGANSVREDRMCLKINGIACIYGCYSHSSLMSTFHRRCYWLLDKPDLVLVHYLQTPDLETGECVINVSNSLFSTVTNGVVNNQSNIPAVASTSTTSSSSSTSNDEFLMGKEDLKSEIKAMLWPYYLNQTFVNENSKSLPAVGGSRALNNKTNNGPITSEEFLDLIVSNLLTFTSNTSTTTTESSSSSSNTSQTLSTPIRINFMAFLNQTTSDILSKCNLEIGKSGELVRTNISDTPRGSSEISRRESKSKQEEMDPRPTNRSVHLSISSCSSKGGEKLMLIGDWSYEAKYSLVIKNIKLDLSLLNKHVLECTLPNFDSLLVVNGESLVTSGEHKVLKTRILIYENDGLFESAVPFEITFSNQSTGPSDVYKHQFFLLERTLALLKAYNVDKFEYGFNEENSRFEKRVCHLVESLTNHIKGKTACSSLSVQRSMIANLTSDHEGKTLLHLCSISGLSGLLRPLIELKHLVDESKNTNELDIIRNELKLLKLDESGFTPLMLSCRYGHEQIALELFQQHQLEFEMNARNNNYSSFNSDIESSSWYFHVVKCIEECGSHEHAELARELHNRLGKFKERWAEKADMLIDKTPLMLSGTQHELDQIPSPQLTSLDPDFNLIDHLEDLNSLLNDDTSTTNAQLASHESEPNNNSGFYLLQKPENNNKSGMYSNCDGFFNLEYSQPTSSTTLQDLQFTINQSPQQPGSTCSFNVAGNNSAKQPLVTQISQTKLNDDQDKKIKALADNIIAAMPYKIKTNSYSISNLNQQQSQQKPNFMTTQQPSSQQQQQPFHQHQIQPQQNSPQIMQFRSNTSPSNLMLKRNATSFDDNYENNSYRNNDYNSYNMSQNHPPRPASNLNYVESCYSSSTRSSLSPTSSITFQYQAGGNDFNNYRHSVNGAGPSCLIDDSPSCQDSSSYDYDSSTFHIDSPPSTAEFCQYFNASSKPGKMAIETGFAQLTLTDDEQRELYEAALVIQNAYRRYIQRKKKKIKLDSPNTTTTNTQAPPNTNKELHLGSVSSQSGPKFDEFSFSRSSSTSLSSLASSNSFKSNSNNTQQQQQPQQIYTAYPSQYIPGNLTSVNVQNGPNQHQFMIQSRANTSEINKNGKDTRLGYDRQRRHNDELSDYDDYDENNSSGEDQRQYQAACVIQKYYRRYRQYENLQKYNDAASKIQTRYRAYKSLSLTSAKSYQYHHHRTPSYSKHLRESGASGNSSTSSINGGSNMSKLQSSFHHSSIDETSSTDDYALTASPSTAGQQATEFTLSNDKPMMSNSAKQLSRKMINARQSPRFSPASLNTANNPNNPSSSSSPLSPPSCSSSSSTSSNSSQQPPQLSHQLSMLDFGHRPPHLVDIRQFISVDQNQPYRRLSDIQPPRYLTLGPANFSNTTHLVGSNNPTHLHHQASSNLFTSNESSESSYFVTDPSLAAHRINNNNTAVGDMSHTGETLPGNSGLNSSTIYQFTPANYNTALSESNFWNYLTKTSVNLKNNLKTKQLNKQQYSKKQQIYPKLSKHHLQSSQSSTTSSNTVTAADSYTTITSEIISNKQPMLVFTRSQPSIDLTPHTIPMTANESTDPSSVMSVNSTPLDTTGCYIETASDTIMLDSNSNGVYLA